MRIVFDTNVWVSGALSREGPPARLVDRAVAGEFFVFASPAQYEELAEVMWRDRIADLISRETRNDYLSRVGYVMIVVEPTETVDVIRRDPADNRVLECALEAEAESIVSGDSHLLDRGDFRGISLLSPRDFLDRLPPGNRKPLYPDL